MEKFKELGLQGKILKGIEDLGFEQPTPIQEKVIPVILGEENDLVALAQTGTGKTAAFGLPLLQKLETALPEVQVQRDKTRLPCSGGNPRTPLRPH